MKLHLHQKNFKDLITLTAQHLKLPHHFIEKDYWITFVLKKLSESSQKDTFVFKGGTSLSKAHKIIERFSEDIDLAVIVPNDLSNNQIKKLIDTTSKELTKDLEEVYLEGFTSKHSRFRKTAHRYPIITNNSLFGIVLTNLILEINSFAQPFPNDLIEIESYLTTYLKSVAQDNLIQKYDMAPFQVRVLGLERTLGEKILALVRASHAEDPIEQLKSKIRHVYDVYKILQLPAMKKILGSKDFFTLLASVQADDAKNVEFQGDWSKEKLSEALIFKDIDATWEHLHSTYHIHFPALMYGTLPSTEEIKQMLMTIFLRLEEYDTTITA